MITVISGTNRKGSHALKFAKLYAEMLRNNTSEEVHLIALEEIPIDWIHAQMYREDAQAESLRIIQDTSIVPAQKMVFVISEYNGGVPGMLKFFIDALSVRAYQPSFAGKKAALVGIATGRAGGLRALDHLSDILQHMGTVVMPNKLPISSIRTLMDETGTITDLNTRSVIQQHAHQVLQF